MAIEKLKKLTVLFPAGESERLEEWLYARAVMHLRKEEIQDEALKERLRPLLAGERGAAENLAAVREVQGEFERVHVKKANFLDSMLPMKTIAGAGEMEKAVAETDFETLKIRLRELREKIHEEESDLKDLESESEVLRVFASLARPLGEIKNLKRTFLIFAEGSAERLEKLNGDDEARKIFAWETAGKDGDRVILAAAGAKDNLDACGDVLRSGGFRIVEYPPCDGIAAERLREIGSERKKIAAETAVLEGELAEKLPERLDRAIRLARGYWESKKRRAENAEKILTGKRIGVGVGYIRAARAPGVIRDIETEFPGVGIAAEDPSPGETVPVSIALPRLFRPGQLLVSMFGLPNYFSIDPTPYLMFVFLAFFGICFADVVYGLLLTWIGWKLVKRYQRQENLREFFRLFLYCGISTTVFGVLTGSWAADIYSPEYLGPNNLLLRFVQKTTVLDMLAKPLTALIAALAIGVMNQFYGIVMRIIKDTRQRNWRGAVYDGVFWLAYLGALLVFALSSLLGWGGRIIPRGALAITGLAAVGLILTQGRDQTSRVGKLAFGLISLYGIVGGYGTTSFIGDVLSYSRLLALGLNTYIVGMSFNIVAKIIPQIIVSVFPFSKAVITLPVVQAAIIIFVMVGGHLFNFFMSIMSAFVHSARLILLEFFGRFYQGDGLEFQPHGFLSDTVELTR